MYKLFGFAFAAVLATVMSLDDASARSRCGDSRSPMVTSQGYGVAACRGHAPRYYSRAHLGEGARGYMRRTSSDPMVWSDARWRSSLMGGYVRNTDSRFDRRFRHDGGGEIRVVKHVERIVVIEEAAAPAKATPAKKRKSRLISLGGDREEIIENSSRFRGHRCSGILVLTWGAGGSRARCYDERGRIRHSL